MRILVLSDSHSHRLTIDYNNYDYVIHCGDYGRSIDELIDNHVIYVRGNCDTIGDKEKEFTLGDKSFYVTHGDLYNVKYKFDSLYFKAISISCDIVCFGHTHNLTYFKEGGITFLNPGEYPYSYIEIIDDEIIMHRDLETEVHKL